MSATSILSSTGLPSSSPSLRRLDGGVAHISTVEEVLQCLQKKKPFAVSKTMKRLDLEGKGLGIDEMKLLIEGLKDNSTLVGFYIGHNKLGDTGVKIICDWLTTNSSVEDVGLDRVEMGKKGIQYFVRLLRSNTSIKTAFLNENNIGDAGALVLRKALRINTSLLKLYLYHNHIGVKGAGYLLEGLKQNPSLKKLDLEQNPCFTTSVRLTIDQILCINGLHRAAYLGNLTDMVNHLNTEEGKRQLFEKQGKEEGTPLHLAVLGDQLEAVRFLLAFGAKTNVSNRKGKRPIDLAKSDEVRQELLRESLETVKMVVLGHGRVGKTTTVKAIKDLEVVGFGQLPRARKVGSEKSTIGLDISSLSVPTKDGEKETKIRVWDFAGQLEYLPCHRQFLSCKRTIFIVVVDGSKAVQKQKEDLAYWLDFISKSIRSRDEEGKFSSERVLMIVGTKIDLREKEDISSSQLEKQYLEEVRRIDANGNVFNKEWIRTASISNLTSPRMLSQLQHELFEMARAVRKNGVVNGSILFQAASVFSTIQERGREAVVCPQEEVSGDIEALEYLHDAGEIAFLKEIGWLCLDGPVLERCVGLFTGPQPHQQALVSSTNREAVMNKEEVISQLEGYISLAYPQVVGGIVSIIEVMRKIGICFESKEKVVFPSELGECHNLTLPPRQQQKGLCYQWSISLKSKEEIGREEFQKVLSALWTMRCEEHRPFVNGMLVIPSSITKLAPSEEENVVALVEVKAGRVIITSRSKETVQEIGDVVLQSLVCDEELVVDKKEEQERSPIWSEVGDNRTSIPKDSLLSSEELAELLSSASTIIPPIKKELNTFFGVVLTSSNSHSGLQREFELVRKKLFEFLSRGHMDFDFELDRAVMVFNSQVESKFMNKMHQYLWAKPSSTIKHPFEEPGSEALKRRQRVLKRLEEYILQVPGSERTNLLLAWHAHERRFLYTNVVNGHFVPTPVDAKTILEIKQGAAHGDLGYFGRGAYFSQTPQYVLPYVRGSGQEFVLQLSWILPGRVYPVIEPTTGPTTLHGQPCIPGFDSHYVLTNGVKPVLLGEEVVGDELVVFSPEQVYPRYLVFLKRATSMLTFDGWIQGTGFRVLPFGPVLVWVDNKIPDVLPEIQMAQGRYKNRFFYPSHKNSLTKTLQEHSPETARVQVFHFWSTGEALSWMAKHSECLFFKAKLGHLRIGTNSYRSGEVEVMAGKRLYQLIRQTMDFAQIPILVYCGDRTTAGFTQQEQDCDPFLQITEQYDEALKFGGQVVRWLEGKRFEWRIINGPGLFVRIIGLVGLSEKKKKERYYTTVTLLTDNEPKKSATWRTEIEVGGCWDAMVPVLSLNQGARMTVYRTRSVKHAVLGWVNITSKDIEKMKSGESEEVEWTLGDGSGAGGRRRTDNHKVLRKGREGRGLITRITKLETDLGWF